MNEYTCVYDNACIRVYGLQLSINDAAGDAAVSAGIRAAQAGGGARPISAAEVTFIRILMRYVLLLQFHNILRLIYQCTDSIYT